MRAIGKIFIVKLQTVLAVFVMLVFSSISVAQETVNIRFADHATFSRVVFDWSEMVSYTAGLDKGELKVIFDQNAVPDLERLRASPLKYFGNPRHMIEDGRLVVIFDVFAENIRLKHFRDGTKTAFDIIKTASIKAEAVKKPEITEQSEHKAEKPAPASHVAKIVAPEKEHVPEKTASAPRKKRLNSDSFEIIEVRVQRSVSKTDIIYPLSWETMAAAFIRSNRLWVVFEDKVEIDHSALMKKTDGRVLSARQLEHPRATVLVYNLTPGQNASMEKKAGNVWRLTLKDSRTAPFVAIPVGQQRGSGMGENVFLSAEDVGSVFLIEDPVAGDELAIVTLKHSSTGVVEGRNFSEFTVLETAQGAAIQLIADDLDVKRYRNGIGISREQGLALSRGSLSTAFKTDSSTKGSRPEHLIDFEQWRKGPLEGEGYDKNRHELLYRLSTSSDEERNASRWNLARFYMATGHAADALGVLELMREREGALDKNAEFRAVLGVANLLLRRNKKALSLLTHKSLIAELDAYLWRSVAQNGAGKYEQALVDFERGIDVLSLQSDEDKARFLFSAIHAGYQVGDIAKMEKFYDLIEELPLSATQLTEMDYWRARMKENSGEWEEAIEEYEKIAKSGVRQTAALARLALVNVKYKNHKNTSAEAIDELEKLRFAWRGDEFELDLLRRLGELYVDQHEYRAGLDTLKIAAIYFRRSNKTRELTKTMSAIYRDLFLNGKADNMDPVKAVALHNDYPELTPLGADGDRISRRLADRLVSVDLLDDAVEVLTHQVFQRLKGVAQSDVAIRLAMIHIMNDAPEEALKVLRGTRHSQMPDDIERRRILVEARALIEMRSYEEAEVILDSQKGADVDTLLASIYWKTENWPRVVSSGQARLRDYEEGNRELDNGERMIILRLALAQYLDGNDGGLDDLRGRYLSPMADGLYADAFGLITNRQEKTGPDARKLTQAIASIERLESFMKSYRNEFASN